MASFWPDLILYGIQFIAMLAVVLVVEFALGRSIINGSTVWLIMWAVAQVGLLVLARLYIAPLAVGSAQDGALYCWWLVFWSFVASAIPVVAWTEISNHQQIQELLERRRRNDN